MKKYTIEIMENGNELYTILQRKDSIFAKNKTVPGNVRINGYTNYLPSKALKKIEHRFRVYGPFKDDF